MRRITGTPWGQTLIISGALLCLAIPLAAVAFALHGWQGIAATAVACGVCLFAGLASLFLVSMFPAPDQVMHQVLFGMFPRMGIPLMACMLTYLHGGMLVEAGFVYYIMAFYFVTLLIETTLLASSKSNKQPTESRTG